MMDDGYMRILSFGKTDVGLVRQNNEDNFVVDELSPRSNATLLVVADGMGGHAKGEVASKIAVDLIRQQIAYGFKNKDIINCVGKNSPYSKYANYLIECINLANQAIFEANQKYPQNRGMGTTIVSALINENNLTIAHIGDSRLYLVRDNDIYQLTADHSVVMEQVRKGLLTLEEAEKSDRQNVLTRALGIEDTVKVDVSEIPLMNNDYILLCSDGLTRMVTDKQILDVIVSVKEPKLICEKLVTLANDAGGKDNVTVVVAHMQKKTSVWKERVKNLLKWNSPCR